MIQIDGQPWFVAADVCAILSHTNPTLAVRLLDKDQKAKSDLGAWRLTNIISESRLYKLALRSDKPEAKGFQDWVTRDVLPAMQRTPASSRCNFWGITSALVSRERERGVYLTNH